MEERRKNFMNQDDRDLLIRVDQNVINLIEKVDNHVKSDSEQFLKHGESIDFLKRTAFLGIGGVFILHIVLQFIFK